MYVLAYKPVLTLTGTGIAGIGGNGGILMAGSLGSVGMVGKLGILGTPRSLTISGTLGTFTIKLNEGICGMVNGNLGILALMLKILSILILGHGKLGNTVKLDKVAKGRGRGSCGKETEITGRGSWS